MDSLIKDLNNHQTGIIRIIAENCEIIVVSREDSNHILISPGINSTQILNKGDVVELPNSDILTTGIRIKTKEEYFWIEIEELKKIRIKEYEELSDEEIKYIVKQITRSSNSEDDVRQKIMDELDYPFSKKGIAIHRLSRIMCSVMLWSPRGKGLMI